VRAKTGSNRVNRGGGWNNHAVNCRSANRNNDAPGNRNDDLGFRLVSASPPFVPVGARFTDRVRVHQARPMALIQRRSGFVRPNNNRGAARGRPQGSKVRGGATGGTRCHLVPLSRIRTMSDEIRIFISCAREDQPRIESLYQKLAAAGYQPWLDREHILPGQR
jgi:hypothetical protein